MKDPHPNLTPSKGTVVSSPPVATARYPAQAVHPHVCHTAEVGQRQGKLCCGCCCDNRRAVIIVDIVVLALEVLVLVLLLTGAAVEYIVVYQDESMKNIEIIFSAISIFLCGVAVYGAIIYNVWLVGLNALWLLLGYIVGLVIVVNYCNEWAAQGPEYYCSLNGSAIITQACIMILWLYPHISFIVQVQKGILSPETYDREAHSCCCIDETRREIARVEQVQAVIPDQMERGAVTTQNYK